MQVPGTRKHTGSPAAMVHPGKLASRLSGCATYRDLPSYRRACKCMSGGLAHRMQEVSFLRRVMPENIRIDADEVEYRWVILLDFPLGRAYRPANCNVLLLLNESERGLEVPTVLLRPGLKAGRRLMCCSDGFHYECDHCDTGIAERGWALFELEFDWDPDTDHLVNAVFRLSEALEDASQGV